ncbi:MAG: GIY-YIG nuclease family protein [SAR202 cluster bacterium]|nr:GIY-YIG nuclease family protein [SAR202 cluster bacterium]
MAFYVYMLKCSDGSYYTGHADNLDKRIGEHQSGFFCGYTKRRRPVRFVFVEEFATRSYALDAEFQIKGWSRAKKEALIRRDWKRIVELSKSHASTSSARAIDS